MVQPKSGVWSAGFPWRAKLLVAGIGMWDVQFRYDRNYTGIFKKSERNVPEVTV